MLIKLPLEISRKNAAWLISYEKTASKASTDSQGFEALECAQTTSRRPVMDRRILTYTYAGEKWLEGLGIPTQSSEPQLRVSRDVMALPAESLHDKLLKELRSGVGTNKVYWGGKDKNWLYLDCF
jgi:hypothetical protein